MELFSKPNALRLFSYYIILLELILIQGNESVAGDVGFIKSENCPLESSVKEPIVYVTNLLGVTHKAIPTNGTINIDGGYGIQIKCRSRAPVKLLFSGLLPNPLSSTQTKIISHSIEDNSDFCHEVSVSFKSTPEATGSYQCTDFATGNGKSVYIYANGNEPPYLLHANRELDAIITGNRVVLPCLLTNSSIPMKLFLGNDELTKKDGIKYDSQEGFSFNLKEFPYGKYQCLVLDKMNNKTYTVAVSLKLQEDDPSRRRPISFERLGDSKHPTFRCNGATSMSYFSCNNPTECHFLRSCAKIVTKSCNIKTSQDCSSYNQPNCREIVKSETDFGGLIVCSNNDPNATKEFNYYTDLKGNVVTNISAKSLDSDSQNVFLTFIPVEYGDWDNADEYWENEELLFNCNASKLSFGDGLKWAFQLTDGRIIEAKPNNDSTFVEKTHYSKTSSIKFNNTRIVKLLCLVPKIDSNGWFNISHKITIKKSYAPTFDDKKNETVTFELADKNPEISCTASGLPLPSFTWYRDGEEITGSINIGTNVINTTVKSSIRLRITAADPPIAVYTCNATNFLSSKLRTITVTKEQNGFLTWDWIAIIATLTLALVFTTVALGYFCLRRSSKEDEYSKEAVQKYYDGDPKTPEEIRNNNDMGSDTSDLMIDSFPYLNLPYRHETEIPDPEKNLILEMESGHGNFGVVYRGKLKRNKVEIPVAVKTLKQGASFEAFEDLLAELKIMQYVGEHDNIVKFIGGVTKDIAKRQALIVVEYCQFNDLRDYLIRNKNSFQSELVQPPNSHYSFTAMVQPNQGGGYTQVQYAIRTSNLIQWSYEIAAGMAYLTSKKLVHRDLAARNVLLTDQLVTKITDFGLSINLYKDLKNYYVPSPTHKTLHVPWRWFSIEAMSSMKFSVESDIWAFGVVMYEIFTLGEDPYFGVPDQFILPFLKEGKRLAKPRYANQAIYEVMLSCWNEDGSQRPRFDQLKYDIEATKKTISQPDSENQSRYINYPELEYYSRSDSDFEEEYNQDENNV